jgi:hypothetical protein
MGLLGIYAYKSKILDSQLSMPDVLLTSTIYGVADMAKVGYSPSLGPNLLLYKVDPLDHK